MSRNPVVTSTARSPFAVGKPLRPDQPLFGREAELQQLAAGLANARNINLVGARGIGKTSLITHLVAYQHHYLPAKPDQPPVILVALYPGADIPNAEHFYGTAMHKLLERIPASHRERAARFDDLCLRLTQQPALKYNEFWQVLDQLSSPRGVHVQPVLVVDDFENLLDRSVKSGFPYPYFFSELRAVLSAHVLSMLMVSQRPLLHYFKDRGSPGNMASTFPTYFHITHRLGPISADAADALLQQASRHTLTPAEAASARRWAGKDLRSLQAAGAAWYLAHEEGQPSKQHAHQHFASLKQAMGTEQPHTQSSSPSDGRVWLLALTAVVILISMVFGWLMMTGS